MKNNSSRKYVIWYKPRDMATDHICNAPIGWLMFDQTDDTDEAHILLSKARAQGEAFLTKRVSIRTYEVGDDE